MNTALESDGSCGVVTLQGLAKQDNFFALNFLKWRHQGEAIYHVTHSQAEQIFGQFVIDTLELGAEDRTDLTPESMIKIFRDELEMVKKDIAARVYRFMPTQYGEILPLSEQNGVPNDPIILLRNIYELKDNQPIGRMEFEWLRNMEMAIFYCYISARHNKWLPSVDDGDQIVQRFTKWLDPSCALNCEIMKIGLDPNDRWRVRSIHSPKLDRTPRPQRSLRYLSRDVFVVRLKALLFPKNQIRAVVQARRKDRFEGFAKRFRDPQSDLWPDVPDMFGIRLIYNSKEDMQNGIILGQHRAIWNNNPAIKYCHTTNKHSQKKMRIKNQRIMVNGRQCEIQHLRLEDWLNIEYSVSTENHTRYHLRWFTDEKGMFMHILPPLLYGKDWTSEIVRRVLTQHVIDQIRDNNEHLTANP